jgi:hypothetical protein
VNQTYEERRAKQQKRRQGMHERRMRHHQMRGTMNYASAFSYLTDKAKVQGRFRVAFRDRDSLHHNYAIHIHGTHVWVPKKEWDRLRQKRESSGDMSYLDPKKYLHVSDKETEVHTYAIPVPGTPVMLRVYQTDVATFTADGNVVLRANGWQGQTTAKWLDMVKHVRIRSIRTDKWTKSRWGLTDTDGTTTLFYDGLTLDRDGKIITEVLPVKKHVIDRAKAKPWHEAVKHFRNLALPFVAMLDGNQVPHPVVEKMKHTQTIYDSKQYAAHVLSCPQEIDEVLLVTLCLLRWQGYNAASWAHGNADHTVHNARYRFENRLKQTYREWAKEHALKEVA